jgi:hypothetical protein
MEIITVWEAMNPFIMGHHQSLLVKSEGGIVGILGLTDIFKKACKTVKDSKG